VVAGLALEWLARRSARPNVVRGVGLVSALLTGALGCSCVGASGILALVVALGLSSGAARLLLPAASRGA
jgi:NhaP-type Na+/H+ or K+/H+ antiporter